MYRIISLMSFLLLFHYSVEAQVSDTIPTTKDDKWANYEHKPKRAALWGLFPGAGQIYNEVGYRRIPHKRNRAWWKVPIIYGGIGTCGYFWYQNYKQGKLLKEEVLFRRENGDSTLLYPQFANATSEDDLINGYAGLDGYFKPGYDLTAKRRDIFLGASIAIYALSIVEAYVDGHFVTFDVSEDLSMSFYPRMMDSKTIGFSWQFNFL
ncbi:DUF5683 domain-containing protein [Paracrocinitomix mangrovi]|uniref:DUF5683 domain-containing protein n=1 Tax=Paracrocinitomix mangrovi TaxID=2862509 RepID=UPI001C8D4231|nr:DUF5683 domain-containing protein [Paracrocinitomix mangrovi]UKN02596.1 DUF5683 domain-containing protein [Paracrocinitomix mangrovi]